MIREYLRPLQLAISHAFKRPFTIKVPFAILEPSPRRAGRHLLDLGQCIGCGLCARACPCRAIELVKVEERPHPTIDYGRCCFCNLCVDACPKGALKTTPLCELAAYSKEDLVLSPEQLSERPDAIRGRPVLAPKFYRRGVFHAPITE